MNVHGVIRDAIVTITLTPQARDVIDTGAAVFRVYDKNEILMMKGIIIYINTEIGEVGNSKSMTFKRQTA